MLVVTRPSSHFGNRKLRFTRLKLRERKLSPAWDDSQNDAAVPPSEDEPQKHVPSLEKLCAESVWAHRDVFCKLPHKDGNHPLQMLRRLIVPNIDFEMLNFIFRFCSVDNQIVDTGPSVGRRKLFE
jgi:hypothetical protein